MRPFTYEDNPLFQIGPEYIVSFRESRSQRSCWWYVGELGGQSWKSGEINSRKANAHRFPDRKSAEQFVKDAKAQSTGLIFCVEEAAT